MLDLPSGGGRLSFPIFGKKREFFRLLVLSFFFLGMISASGCEDVKPLSPDQQSIVSAWNVREQLEHAYALESVDNVLNLLSPELASAPNTRSTLSKLFGMLKSVDLHLSMDSGQIDTTAREIHFRAHWTLTGLSSGKAERYFQTGECRLVVSLRKAPLPAQILRIEGDSFLSAPGKFSPAS
jgi:hypothetical protein